MSNNPIIGWGAGAGAEYITKRNRGCRQARYIFGIVVGLLFAAGGLYSLATGDSVGGVVFLILGLLFIILFYKALKQ